MSVEISSNIIVIAINLIVGGRLLKQAVSRSALPEFLLGASLVFDGIEWFLWMLAFYTPLAGTPIADYLTAACRAGIAISMLFMILFIRSVFRPNSAWAIVFALSISLTIFTGLVVGIYLGDLTGFASDRIWLWLELGGTQVAYTWCFAEAITYYSKMSKRAAHGLADPIVTNRVLLWSFYAVCGMITELIYISAIVMAGPNGSYPFLFDAIMIVTTTTGALIVVLAFFPPKLYLQWVVANSAATSE